MKKEDIKCTKCGSGDLQPTFEIEDDKSGKVPYFPNLITSGRLLCNSCGALCEIKRN